MGSYFVGDGKRVLNLWQKRKTMQIKVESIYTAGTTTILIKISARSSGLISKKILFSNCKMSMATNGRLLPANFQEGSFLLYQRSDNCVKNHFYSKLRKGLRKVNKKIHKYLNK